MAPCVLAEPTPPRMVLAAAHASPSVSGSRQCDGGALFSLRTLPNPSTQGRKFTVIHGNTTQAPTHMRSRRPGGSQGPGRTGAALLAFCHNIPGTARDPGAATAPRARGSSTVGNPAVDEIHVQAGSPTCVRAFKHRRWLCHTDGNPEVEARASPTNNVDSQPSLPLYHAQLQRRTVGALELQHTVPSSSVNRLRVRDRERTHATRPPGSGQELRRAILFAGAGTK